MAEKLGIDKCKIPDLCTLLYKNYGTTMAGLKCTYFVVRAIGYDFDNDEYHCFVHGRLPYENLKLDPVLRNLLLSLPYRKGIFTNADKVHAAKVLKRLGLEGCFEGIICFETLNPCLPIGMVADVASSDAFHIFQYVFCFKVDTELHVALLWSGFFYTEKLNGMQKREMKEP